jgi:hypothetical protein
MRWSLMLVAAACTHMPAPTVTKEMPTSPDLDVLFMIDNSAQIADKQTVFTSDFPAFVAALDQFPGGRPNLHVGVVDSTVDFGSAGLDPAGCPSPNLKDDGRLQNTACIEGCTPPTGRYISDIANPDGTRTTNYTGTLDQALACVAEVGAGGCGFESQLLAIERALDGTHPENAGFLRPDADLAIVILTDEDDCSIVDPTLLGLPADTVGGLSDFRCQPMCAYDCDRPITAGSETETYTNCHPHPGGYLRDLDALYATLAMIKDPSQISVSLIAGDPESTITTGSLTFGGGIEDPALFPSCRATVNGNPALARPGIRLEAFADRFAPNSSFASVCQADYTQALVAAEATMTSMMTSPCLDASVDTSDTDATNPGLQPACTVVDQLDFGQPDQSILTMPTCPMIGATQPDPNGPRPCWWAAIDESCLPSSELSLQIERNTPAPPGTVVSETCAKAH